MLGMTPKKRTYPCHRSRRIHGWPRYSVHVSGLRVVSFTLQYLGSWAQSTLNSNHLVLPFEHSFLPISFTEDFGVAFLCLIVPRHSVTGRPHAPLLTYTTTLIRVNNLISPITIDTHDCQEHSKAGDLLF